MRGLAIILGAILWLGCAARHQADNGESPTQIVLLGFHDCPNTPELRDSLSSALRMIGGGLTFTELNLKMLPSEDPRRRWPAPTVLVNGEDLFGSRPRDTAAIGCRIYSEEEMHPDEIARRLRSMLTGNP